jgi:hypothetical protein
MRNISFAMTTSQFRNRSKTVTRRLGWHNLQAGDELMACVKCMGLKSGESIEKLGPIRVVKVTHEELRLCTDQDAVREGFPQLSGAKFVAMFCEIMKCKPDRLVTRIEFEYLDLAVLNA